MLGREVLELLLRENTSAACFLHGGHQSEPVNSSEEELLLGLRLRQRLGVVVDQPSAAAWKRAEHREGRDGEANERSAGC